MSMFWRADKPRARVWLALQCAGEQGLTRAQLLEALRIGYASLSATITALKVDGWIAEGKGGSYVLVADKLPPIQGLAGDHAPGNIIALGTKAEALLRQKAAGLDAFEMAAHLVCCPETVDAVLELAVQAQLMVRCSVTTAHGTRWHYRMASVHPPFSWKAQAERIWATTRARLHGAAQSADRRATAPEVAAAATRPLPTPPPTPTVAPAAEPATEVAADEELRVITETKPLAKLPVLEQRESAEFIAAARGAEERCIFALHSNGALLIESNDRRVTLPIDHARQLFVYLRDVGAERLLNAGLPETT